MLASWQARRPSEAYWLFELSPAAPVCLLWVTRIAFAGFFLGPSVLAPKSRGWGPPLPVATFLSSFLPSNGYFFRSVGRP